MPILLNKPKAARRFVYIITDRNRKSLHVGLSTDLMQTMNFYRQMPSLLFDTGQHLSRLVYFEELNSEATARESFELINRFTRIQKERMIRSVNPDWLDLTVGLDFEQILHSGIQMPKMPAPSLF